MRTKSAPTHPRNNLRLCSRVTNVVFNRQPASCWHFEEVRTCRSLRRSHHMGAGPRGSRFDARRWSRMFQEAILIASGCRVRLPALQRLCIGDCRVPQRLKAMQLDYQKLKMAGLSPVALGTRRTTKRPPACQNKGTANLPCRLVEMLQHIGTAPQREAFGREMLPRPCSSRRAQGLLANRRHLGAAV